MARRLIWVGSSQKDFSAFPEKVKDDMLTALGLAQEGLKAEHAKLLKGFSGASVQAIVESDPGEHIVVCIQFDSRQGFMFYTHSRKNLARVLPHHRSIST